MLISSSPDERKRKPRERKRDHRGDANGVIERARDGASRDDIISIRWIANRLRDCSSADSLDREDDDFVDSVADVASKFEWGAASWRVFQLLWRATERRVRAGMVYDAADLLVTGRYGSAEEIVGDLLAGKYATAPRDSDGFLLIEQDGDTP
jgi:hypothetical protein